MSSIQLLGNRLVEWFLAYILLLLLVCWLTRLTVAAVGVRRQLRQRVRPIVEPTVLENLPITFRPRLAEKMSQLRELGFLPVANVTMQEGQVVRQISQALLINRSAKERVSIFCQVVRNKYIMETTFVAEFSDGTEMKTSDLPTLNADRIMRRSGFHMVHVLPGTSVKQLHERHTEHVASCAPKDVDRVLPPEGGEMEYITNRHAQARAMSMPQNGFIIDATREWYQPGWPRAFKIGIAQQWPQRLLLQWRQNRRIKALVATLQPTSTSVSQGEN